MEQGDGDDKHSSLQSVTWALVGNSIIFAAKLIVGLLTGSGALLAEAVHSAGDTLGQGSLLGGILIGRKKPTKTHPLGYGKARYVCNLVAVVIIAALASFAIIHAASALIEGKHPDYLIADNDLFSLFSVGITQAMIAIIILAVSGIIEFRVFLVARKEVWVQKGSSGIIEYYQETTDPTALAVLVEDFFAVIGVAAAILGVVLSLLTGSPAWDAVASFVIGVLMLIMAVMFGFINLTLLIGRAHLKTEREVERILRAHKGVKRVIEVLALVRGANEVIVIAIIEPQEEMIYREVINGNGGRHPGQPRPLDKEIVEEVVEEVDDLLDELKNRIMLQCPQVKRVIIEVQQLDLKNW